MTARWFHWQHYIFSSFLPHYWLKTDGLWPALLLHTVDDSELFWLFLLLVVVFDKSKRWLLDLINCRDQRGSGPNYFAGYTAARRSEPLHLPADWDTQQFCPWATPTWLASHPVVSDIRLKSGFLLDGLEVSLLYTSEGKGVQSEKKKPCHAAAAAQ